MMKTMTSNTSDCINSSPYKNAPNEQQPLATKHQPQVQSTTSDVTDDGRNKPDINLLKESYAERLNTYRNRWRLSFLEPESLASAGFYYTGYSDIVCCPFCNVEVGKWVEGDDPLADHIKWSPTCSFLQRQLCSDNSTQQQEASGTGGAQSAGAGASSGSGHDTCGKYDIVQSSTSIPENSSVVAGGASLPSVAGIHKVKRPIYEHYAALEKRLDTFRDWPVSIAQKPKELAEAGFFYTGKSDQTVCYHCGGGLKDWESNDQPWQQHAKWFPQCPFVVLQKGLEYVEDQQREKVAGAAQDPAEGAAAAAAAEAAPAAPAEKEDDPLHNTPNSVLCKICFSKEVGVVFLPCGHMVACVDCAPVLTTCAVCRKKVDAHIRAFLS